MSKIGVFIIALAVWAAVLQPTDVGLAKMAAYEEIPAGDHGGLKIVSQPAKAAGEEIVEKSSFAGSDVIVTDYVLNARDQLLDVSEGQEIDIDHPEGGTYTYRVVSVKHSGGIANTDRVQLARVDNDMYTAVMTVDKTEKVIMMTMYGRDIAYSIFSDPSQTVIVDQTNYRELTNESSNDFIDVPAK